MSFVTSSVSINWGPATGSRDSTAVASSGTTSHCRISPSTDADAQRSTLVSTGGHQPGSTPRSHRADWRRGEG
ncbi:hypothetical protein EGH22_05600 [Halomicroarcula sp. F28]|uniref:hypothetical protein n=1 Tax=Haloarcula salinisoli TaxID=2487746 RepID=UPI001C73DBDC|nr:hypothetical protein [Halomicroarcula salinisoli]MBX0285791.1 hypothetical protein [Halomicroarcula salinisoli]